MAKPWTPHGLIQHPGLEHFYQEAQVSVRNGVIVNAKEGKTITLFNNTFRFIVYPPREFAISPRGSPARNSDLKCDLVVLKYSKDWEPWILCLCEGERAIKSQPSEIKAVEAQVKKHCNAFLDEGSDRIATFACAMYGTRVRCFIVWSTRREIEPLWDQNVDNDNGGYLDVGLDEHLPYLDSAFTRMKTSSFQGDISLGQT